MAGIAQLANELGHQVSGTDQNVYPPMSDQLQEQGIQLCQGYDPKHLLTHTPDLVVIGNAMSRGNPMVEYVLEQRIPYISGPQWLHDHLLKDKWVLAIAGTHGKTTTSSMLASILDYAGMKPGFLIGGVPREFGVSARLGDSPFFVVEADEYDSAFFDKRSKFVHYTPSTLVMNNLEFDHADIFDSLRDIQKQFHHVIRTVPSNGLVLYPANNAALQEVIDMGCWTPTQQMDIADSVQPNLTWQAIPTSSDGSRFELFLHEELVGEVNWSLLGKHNIQNALSAIAAARNVGVTPEIAIEALAQFEAPKRRLEKLGVVNNITVYDDFAHHPTAISSTLQGMRKRVDNDESRKSQRVIAVIELRSNTMKAGIHQHVLLNAVQNADVAYFYCANDPQWLHEMLAGEQAIDGSSATAVFVYSTLDELQQTLCEQSKAGDHLVVMSNGGFGGIHRNLLEQLSH